MRSRADQLQQACDAFNAAHPPGTKITVRIVQGEPAEHIRTVSRHGAGVLGGHSAVVYVSDGGGCWALDHVTGRAKETTTGRAKETTTL